MAREDTLRLLLIAEIPADVESIEAMLSAIVARLDVLDTATRMHTAAHARIDALLAARDRLTAPAPGGGC